MSLRSWFSTSSKSHQGAFRQSSGPPRLPAYIWITAGGTTALFGYFYFAYLDEVPLTKRKRWIATSPQSERQLGDQEYKKLLQHYRKDILPVDHRASQTLQRVGKRIAKASFDFGKQNNVSTYTQGAPPYTYTVIRSDMANAFVLPGNHVFLMTGLFKYVKDEDDLAMVLGHEVAHNIARHAGEKISGSIVVNMLSRLSLLIDPSGLMLTLMLPAATVFRELPHSRIQEMEADEIGLQIAADACFDPRAAKRVFQAMKNGENSGQGGPEFLSTHPSHDTRISNFDKWLPDAMQRYQSDMGQRCRPVREQMKLARQAAAQQAERREATSTRNIRVLG